MPDHPPQTFSRFKYAEEYAKELHDNGRLFRFTNEHGIVNEDDYFSDRFTVADLGPAPEELVGRVGQQVENKPTRKIITKHTVWLIDEPRFRFARVPRDEYEEASTLVVDWRSYNLLIESAPRPSKSKSGKTAVDFAVFFDPEPGRRHDSLHSAYYVEEQG